MKWFVILIFMTILTAGAVFAQTPPIETGVSNTLAKWRAANYSDVRYKLNITLEKGVPLMKGDIEIRVNLTDAGAKNDLILDWRTTQFENDKDKPFADVVSVNAATMGKATQSATFDYQTLKEHLLISQRFLKAGENVIKINFASPIKTSGAAITRYVDKEDGAEYVYSLFVPSDASTAFPVFDQPDLKARFKLEVLAPENWEVISNSPERIYAGKVVNSIVSEPSSLRDRIPKDKNLYDFIETKPISSYVFAFAAGEFKKFESDAKDTIDTEPTLRKRKTEEGQTKPRIYVRKSQAEKFKQHAAEVFRLNREGVKFLESWFDYKFPFPKYDLVLIPEFPFGGMEHAGATFLREDRVIFPTEPTKNDYITRANVIFHEAAHQWFGDLVTMRWFDDLWLKEGFAEFMAYKTLEKVMPEYNAWKIFYERNKQAAYLTDSTRGTTPIYQEIPNLSAAKSAYGNIVYRKAPSFLRQAEFYLGEDKFQTAVRAFLKKHEFANAEWTDLVKEFETASKLDLKDWGESWIKQRGMPIVEIKRITYRGPITYGYMITQKSVLEDRSSWIIKFNVLQVFEGNQRESRDLTLYQYAPPNERRAAIIDRIFSRSENASGTEVSHENRKTLFLFPNYQDYGYGIFLLDEESRAYVLANIQTEKDDFLRTMMWGALWDSVREGELAPKDYVALVINNISVESDESTIQTLLGRVSTAMNYYLSDAQSKELAPQVENLLIEKMQNAPTLGQRITFYRAFLNVASTDKARQTLKDVLSGEFEIEGLNRRGDGLSAPAVSRESISSNRKVSGEDKPSPLQSLLKSKDKFDIVTRLSILNDKDAPQLLSELEKTETSDEAKRYAYAARAGIGTTENAAKFWNDFTNNKELSESYIESAFVPFNSPRRADLTLPYLEKALAELPNLKRTRKIFFVNGWLAAFIGGQKSAEALAIVNKFLADNPNLDKDLRLKILEVADGLERGVKIRNKFNR